MGHEVFQNTQVESGRVGSGHTWCSKSHGSGRAGSGGFQVSRVGLHHPDTIASDPREKSDLTRENP